MSPPVKDYRRFADRVCNLREAGFIGCGFVVAVVVVGAIILGIYFGTQCGEGFTPCQDGYTCVANTQLCDGNRNCPIGDDEWKCYPRNFYVSFRTRIADGGIFTPGGNTALADEGSAIREAAKYEQLIENAIKAYNFNVTLDGAHPVSVFRFRKVADNGAAGSEDSAFVAVDALVSFAVQTGLHIDDTSGIAYNKYRVSNATLASAIAGGIPDVFFDAQGAGITTGVGVVLSGPDACNRPKVYCNLDCDDPFVYGSSKGCPEYPCKCSTKKV